MRRDCFIYAKPEGKLAEEIKVGGNFIFRTDLSACSNFLRLGIIQPKIPVNPAGAVISNITTKWLFYKQGRFKLGTRGLSCWEEGM